MDRPAAATSPEARGRREIMRENPMEQKSPRDAELTAQGWTRQFSAGSPRLEEAVENYRELGFEIILEPVDLNPSDGTCTSCMSENPDLVRVIYTRPSEPGLD